MSRRRRPYKPETQEEYKTRRAKIDAKIWEETEAERKEEAKRLKEYNADSPRVRELKRQIKIEEEIKEGYEAPVRVIIEGQEDEAEKRRINAQKLVDFNRLGAATFDEQEPIKYEWDAAQGKNVVTKDHTLSEPNTRGKKYGWNEATQKNEWH